VDAALADLGNKPEDGTIIGAIANPVPTFRDFSKNDLRVILFSTMRSSFGFELKGLICGHWPFQ
jgi:hypothetical protein